MSLRGNFFNRQSRCISVAVKRRTKRPSAMNWMSPQRARCGSGAKPNNLTPSWCVLMRGDERESSFRQRAARAKQNLESGFWGAALSAARPGLYSGLSTVVSLSLILGCCAETKRPFTLTLTHGHPPLPPTITTGTNAEESTPALRYQSPLHPLADGRCSRLM